MGLLMRVDKCALMEIHRSDFSSDSQLMRDDGG